MAYRSVVLNTPALNDLLRNPNGKVGRYFGAVGRAVTVRAKELASDELESHRPDGYHSRFKTTTVAGGPSGFKVVISNDSRTGGNEPRALAPLIERGTRPHGPKTANFLVFQIGGQTIFTKWVKGIKPYRIMTRALHDVLRRPAGSRGA